MWKEFQPRMGTTTTAVAICKATRVHSYGSAVIAILLNTSMPTEHIIQQATPTNVSWLALAGAIARRKGNQ